MKPSEKNSRVEFFGAFIDPLTMEETLARIKALVRSGGSARHCVVNVAKLVMMRDDPALREAVNSSGLINADGAGIVWGAGLLGVNIPERVAGIDLMQSLVRMASENDLSVYFLGARKNVVEEAVKRFRDMYPLLRVAGSRDGYFDTHEESAVASDIKKASPDMLFVGIPSPKKEFFLRDNFEAMGAPFAMGVGGSFDVVAGSAARAPLWMRERGLEWFYRFLQEPGRMWKRYLFTNSRYLFMLIGALLLGARSKRRP